ncbi:MAG: hypothetical protein JWO47_121 [Candidatus Saccharibacteria bacterium]|nr:hypothetical protein [Candidatus Saccharibacteria bacterium]
MSDLAHETPPQDGHYYQSYTFSFDGTSFSLDPYMPETLAAEIAGDEWRAKLAPTEPGSNDVQAGLVDTITN